MTCVRTLQDAITSRARSYDRATNRKWLYLSGLFIAGFAPSAYSQAWNGPWDWSGCITAPSPTPPATSFPSGSTCIGGFPEISHAALIPAGLYQGKVLFWHQGWEIEDPGTDQHCNYNIAQAWIWNPDTAGSPATVPTTNGLVAVEENLFSDIFCSGISWDKRGELVIAGGNRNVNLSEIYRFRASSLARPPMTPLSGCGSYEIPPATYTVWTTTMTSAPVGPMPSLVTRRYYPTAIALSRKLLTFSGGAQIVNGSHLIIGGLPIAGGMTGFPTWNSLWEFLPYGYTEASPPVAIPTVQAPSLGMPTSTNTYTLNSQPGDPPPSPYFLDYPRAFQMSNGDILVSNDADTDGFATNPNGLTDWWVMRPYASPMELWRGPTTGSPKTPHVYGSAVLMHQVNGTWPSPVNVWDRVLVFGGGDPTPGAPYSVSNAVEEFLPANGTTSAGGPIANGTWVAKTSMAARRYFSNAVMLPTGNVLLTGGQDASMTPVLQPEIYDPQGASAGTGSTTLMPPGNVPTGGTYPTARLYHHVALLLPDGSVFIAGGKPPPAGASASAGDYTGEIFLPPYMTVTQPAATIRGAPSITDQIPENGSGVLDLSLINFDESRYVVDRIVLTRPGAVTHFFDNDQRYIELPIHIQARDGADWVVKFDPLRENLGPAGMYLLWVVVTDTTNNMRIPLHSTFIYFN